MFGKIKEKAASKTEMPKDIILDLPLITLIGNKEVTIENFKGILEYTDDIVKIKTSIGILLVEGKKLFLKQVTSEIISVSGTVDGIRNIY